MTREAPPPDSDYPLEWRLEEEEDDDDKSSQLDEMLKEEEVTGVTMDDQEQRASQLIVLPSELYMAQRDSNDRDRDRDRMVMLIQPQPDFGDDISTIVQDEDVVDEHSMGGMTPAPSNPSTPERQGNKNVLPVSQTPSLLDVDPPVLPPQLEPLALPSLPSRPLSRNRGTAAATASPRIADLSTMESNDDQDKKRLYRKEDDTSLTLPETPEKQDDVVFLDNYAEHSGLVRWTIHPFQHQGKGQGQDQDQDSFVDNKTAVTLTTSALTASTHAQRRNRRCRCFFLSIGSCAAMCLLAGIAILSISLYQVRREDNWKWSHLISFFDSEEASSAYVLGVENDASPSSDLDVQLPTTMSPTMATTAAATLASPTRMPTTKLTMQPSVAIHHDGIIVPPSASTTTTTTTSSPTDSSTEKETILPTFSSSNEATTFDDYQDILLQTVNHEAHFPNLFEQLQDSNSVQSQVLEWMRRSTGILAPPQSVEPWKVIQRFALGVFSLQTLGMAVNTTSNFGRWMSFQEHECDWPMNTNRQGEFLPVCNDLRRVVQLVWHDAATNNNNNHNNDRVVTLPPEMGLLTDMQIFELQRHSLQGTLPTQLGLLTNLRRINLANNNLQSTIPTELGQLTKLNRIHFNDNSLRGTLPNELSNLWESLRQIHWQHNQLTGNLPQEWMVLGQLDRLKLNSNQLQGSLSASLLMDLPRLREVTLQENNLTGSIPDEVCNRLVKAKVDCEDIECDCCENCETLARGSTSLTASPTSFVPPPPATTPPPPTPTEIECVEDWIESVRSCYLQGEAIEFTIRNCRPRPDEDRVALYRVSDLRSSGLRNDFFWMPTCGQTTCESMIFESRLYDDASAALAMGAFQELSRTPWPLETDEYSFLLLRVLNPGSVRILAASDPFRVAASLGDCDQ